MSINERYMRINYIEPDEECVILERECEELQEQLAEARIEIYRLLVECRRLRIKCGPSEMIESDYVAGGEV